MLRPASRKGFLRLVCTFGRCRRAAAFRPAFISACSDAKAAMALFEGVFEYPGLWPSAEIVTRATPTEAAQERLGLVGPPRLLLYCLFCVSCRQSDSPEVVRGRSGSGCAGASSRRGGPRARRAKG